MGFLDQIGGMLGGGTSAEGESGGGPAGGLGALGGLMDAHGGIGGLVSAFQANGLGGVVNSWVSNGDNAPISADQITQVLGSGVVGDFARKLGVDPQEAASHLSELLPQVIDHLTPHGEVPADGQPGADALGGLAGLLNRFR